MPRVGVFHRGRLRELSGVSARSVGGNAWEIALPVDHPIHAITRRRPEPEAWDGAVFLIDDEETEPGLGTGLRDGCVLVTALVL